MPEACDFLPAGVSRAAAAAIELPESLPPAIPLWAENYIYEITCAAAGVSMFLHLGRMSFDTRLWRDTVVIDTGADEVYVYRGFGRNAGDEGPGGSQLRFVMQEPFRRWSLHFEGAALCAARSDLSPNGVGALRDGPIVPLSLWLTAEADGPVWDLGQSITAHDWGKAHYQQSMRITAGELRIGGEVKTLSGLATRDHTRGPRDFSSLGSYAWIHGGIPGGRRFITLALDARPGFPQPPVRIGIITEADRMTKVEVLETAIPQRLDGGSPSYVLRLRAPDGLHVIEAERLHTVTLAVGAPNHLMLGPSTHPSCVAHMFPSPTRFRWNGEVCYGFSERSFARVTASA